MAKSFRITLIVMVAIALVYWVSPVYLLPKTDWNALGFCKGKGWSDWYGVWHKGDRDIIVCDVINDS